MIAVFRRGWALGTAAWAVVLGALFVLGGGWAAQAWVLLGHAVAYVVLGRLWVDLAGTALRPAVAWSGIALGLFTANALLGTGLGVREPVPPIAAGLTYLGALAVLASLVSVLNARWPGAGVWSWLMVVLVAIFVIPALAASRGDIWGAVGRLARLEVSWAMFYGVLAAVSLGNYAGTRWRWAVLTLGLLLGGWLLASLFAGDAGLGLARLALVAGVPFVWVMLGMPGATEDAGDASPRGRLERLWRWFRDRWGAAWALRILERFNREAEVAGWSFRLTWQGVAPSGEGGAIDDADLEAAIRVLRGLLHRFARPWRLERVSAAPVPAAVGGEPRPA
jgi:hypothetical protein